MAKKEKNSKKCCVCKQKVQEKNDNDLCDECQKESSDHHYNLSVNNELEMSFDIAHGWYDQYLTTYFYMKLKRNIIIEKGQKVTDLNSINTFIYALPITVLKSECLKEDKNCNLYLYNY